VHTLSGRALHPTTTPFPFSTDKYFIIHAQKAFKMEGFPLTAGCKLRFKVRGDLGILSLLVLLSKHEEDGFEASKIRMSSLDVWTCMSSGSIDVMANLKI
jgi:hypothetical protein